MTISILVEMWIERSDLLKIMQQGPPPLPPPCIWREFCYSKKLFLFIATPSITYMQTLNLDFWNKGDFNKQNDGSQDVHFPIPRNGDCWITWQREIKVQINWF